MVEQPSGTVTLVFTDIEGSTRLLHELGQEAYREALVKHREIVREVFARHAGYEVDDEGDSFFYVFGSATGAVTAVEEVRAAIEDGPIRIRVGVHTGEPGLDPPKYVGLDVHRAARIMSAGHGGQVLLSKATRQLIGESFLLRDLGEHRLKDMIAPERLYQLGQGAYPPVKSLDYTNLPSPVSAFLGREAELDQADTLLGSCRLLTVTGPGGTGKTRFAIELASRQLPRFPDGVFWVPLAGLREPTLVLSTAAQTLGSKDDLEAHIGSRRMLLVLDNFEQVIDAAIDLSLLLASCAHLSVLVTSRELLRVQGEVEYSLPPLVKDEAVELFCERARTEQSDAIGDLCRRLDNLPLAIELAAARTSLLSPELLLERLSRNLDLLKGGRDADPRQLTLRATIEWSYNLLASDERELFARLSVFAGGCTLAAAEEIARADLDTLASLAGKSLVRADADRFWMLETIREYAAERLGEKDDLDELRAAHAAYYERLAASGERGLRTSEHASWTARLVEDQANFRLAIESSLDDGDGGRALRIATRLWPFWESRAPTEGSAWLEQALAARAGTVAERAQALHAAGRLAFFQGDMERAVESLSEAIELSRQAADHETLVISLGECSWVLEELGRHDQAIAYADECLTLASEIADPWVRAEALSDVANAKLYAGDEVGSAEELLAESLQLRRALGAQQLIADSLNNVGWAALLRGNDEDARRPLEESLQLAREIGDDFRTTLALGNLGLVALLQDRYQDSVTLLSENLDLCIKRGDRRQGSEAVLGLAAALAALNNPEIAIRLHAAAHAHLEAMGEVYPAAILDRIERHLQPARAALAEDVVATLSAHGRTMGLEAVLAELDSSD